MIDLFNSDGLERAQRHHIRRQHQQSSQQTCGGYPLPHPPKRGGWIGYAVFLVVTAGLVVYENFYNDVPAQTCAVVAQK